MICIEWSQFAVPAAVCDWSCCKVWLPSTVKIRRHTLPTLCMLLPTLTDGVACSYVRLELLQGVAAFHSQDGREALRLLQSAQAKWQRLQVSDESLAALASMGFPTHQASFCAGHGCSVCCTLHSCVTNHASLRP